SQRLYISWLTGEEGKAKPPQPSTFLYEARLLEGPPPQRDAAQPQPLVRAWEQRRESRATARTSSSAAGSRGKAPTTKSSTRRTGPTGATPARAGSNAPSRGRSGASSSRAASATTPGPAVAGHDVGTAEALPPLDIAMPEKGQRRMDFRRDGDIRRFVQELTDPSAAIRLEKVSIASDAGEETFPLQLALLLNGIPYTIAAEDRLLASPHLAAVYRTLTNAEPAFQQRIEQRIEQRVGQRVGQRIEQKPVAPSAPSRSPYKGLAIRLLVRVAREFGISSREGTDRLHDAIEHAIRTAADQDPRGIRFVRRATPLAKP
ncbi:MAG: hypothetical protein ACTHQE_02630, partial [Thermomicrobiales bacterium]